MYQNVIDDLPKLKKEYYENIFPVYTDENDRYYYNLLHTVSIPDNLPDGYYKEYIVKSGDTWPYISYKEYGTPNVWWLIMNANNLTNPLVFPKPGTTLKLLRANVVNMIISQISTQKN